MAAAEDKADALVNSLIEAVNASEKVDNSIEFAKSKNVDHQDVVGAIKTLEAAFYVTTDKKQYDVYELSKEGSELVAAGKTPEMALFLALTEEGVETSALNEMLGKEIVQLGMGPNMKNKWASKKGTLIVRTAHPGMCCCCCC
jgi:DNA-binding MarR family transcriptional regulator